MIQSNLNFRIINSGIFSKNFIDRNILEFAAASAYIKQLPYKRNSNKHDLSIVFKENCGTCSTKHALLKQLAMENGVGELKLKLCIFGMNKENTPAVKGVLEKHKLEYIPEAHNYLTYKKEVIDCTTRSSTKENFINDVIAEIEIEPNQISDFKINYHKEFLGRWLKQNPHIMFSIDELWRIREECISVFGF